MSRMWYKLGWSVLIFFQYFSVLAQEVKGRVVDEEGTPLVMANVFVNFGASHTHTNGLGEFLLASAKSGDTLEISSLGFSSTKLILRSSHFQEPVQVILKESVYDMRQVVVSDNRAIHNPLINLDLNLNPVTSSQEILQKVPGLIIGQHAGGGKAEQMFLRGFDLDHGTDLSLSVDGMPVNMVSHAHGQGYADLHFLIPEVIDRIDYMKGPYETGSGNFATAGQVSFYTKDRISASSLSLEYGKFNTFRVLGLFDLDLFGDSDRSDAYLAIEDLRSDGPFDASQDFHRSNLFGKIRHKFRNGSAFTLSVGRFSSSWKASGQIPERAVKQHLISRFGAIGDLEGGNTARTNLTLGYTANLGDRAFLKTNAYIINYDFELYSDFTFFLRDSINGDQIKQKESRNVIGFDTRIYKETQLGKRSFSWQGGVGMRTDRISDIELSHTLKRTTVLESNYLGDIAETNLSTFAEGALDLGSTTISTGIRLDHFNFSYQDKLPGNALYQAKTAQLLSPSLVIVHSKNAHWQHFMKIGKGFHTNDSRVVSAEINLPETPISRFVPSAYGIDLGTNWSPKPRVMITSALWHLLSQQEFVYVGDEGIVEASGRSRRLGLDLGARAQINDGLFIFSDYTYTYSRSIEEPSGDNYIPLAPAHTFTGGFNYRQEKGISGGLRFVYLGDRPANTDYTIKAEGYFKIDANVQYEFKGNLTLALVIQNLLDTKWNEAQFATESRLAGESNSVEEIHFTPGIPFAPRLKFNYRF